MYTRISIVKFLIVLVGGTILGGLVLGAIGFLLAGRAGFTNLVIPGLVAGLFGTLIVGFAMLLRSYDADTYGETKVKNLAYGWFVKTAGGKHSSRNEK